VSATCARPKLGFAQALDMDRIADWSWYGTVTHMRRALEASCGDVVSLGPLNCIEQQMARVYDRALRTVAHKKYPRLNNQLVARGYARMLAKRLRQQPVDVIFAPMGCTEVAFLETDIPIIISEDATYGQLVDYYPEYSNLSRLGVAGLHQIERASLARASALISSTEWAARSAIADFGADERKVHVVPFGANLDHVPPREAAIRARPSQDLRILFIGTNWKRKGGDLALATWRELDRRGVAAHLTIVGSQPPDGFTHKRLTVYPYLDKEDHAQLRAFMRLYAEADVFLLPTRGDASPIVFSEAAAHGLPVVATETGGVGQVVSNGENGILLPLAATAREYADAVMRLTGDADAYARMSRAGRDAYDARLSWDAWGKRTAAIIADVLAARRAAHSASGSGFVGRLVPAVLE
jgi:glycosyltransferase involved in cell wall biosynthesis